jgi:predicted nucleotidyltransferase
MQDNKINNTLNINLNNLAVKLCDKQLNLIKEIVNDFNVKQNNNNVLTSHRLELLQLYGPELYNITHNTPNNTANSLKLLIIYRASHHSFWLDRLPKLLHYFKKENCENQRNITGKTVNYLGNLGINSWRSVNNNNTNTTTNNNNESNIDEKAIDDDNNSVDNFTSDVSIYCYELSQFARILVNGNPAVNDVMFLYYQALTDNNPSNFMSNPILAKFLIYISPQFQEFIGKFVMDSTVMNGLVNVRYLRQSHGITTKLLAPIKATYLPFLIKHKKTGQIVNPHKIQKALDREKLDLHYSNLIANNAESRLLLGYHRINSIRMGLNKQIPIIYRDNISDQGSKHLNLIQEILSSDLSVIDQSLLDKVQLIFSDFESLFISINEEYLRIATKLPNSTFTWTPNKITIIQPIDKLLFNCRFQDRIPNSINKSLVDTTSSKLKHHLCELKLDHLNADQIILIGSGGSRLYNCNGVTSDTDYFIIYTQTLFDQCSIVVQDKFVLDHGDEQFKLDKSNEVEYSGMELLLFAETLLKSHPVMIEHLAVNHYLVDTSNNNIFIYESKFFKELQSNCNRFLTLRTLYHYFNNAEFSINKIKTLLNFNSKMSEIEWLSNNQRAAKYFYQLVHKLLDLRKILTARPNWKLQNENTDIIGCTVLPTVFVNELHRKFILNIRGRDHNAAAYKTKHDATNNNSIFSTSKQGKNLANNDNNHDTKHNGNDSGNTISLSECGEFGSCGPLLIAIDNWNKDNRNNLQFTNEELYSICNDELTSCTQWYNAHHSLLFDTDAGLVYTTRFPNEGDSLWLQNWLLSIRESQTY